MNTIEISEGPLRARIEPSIGAGMSGLALRGPHGWAEVLRPAPAATRFADLSMYLMTPWTNRTSGAAFHFSGKEYRLRPDWEDGTAIHGDVKARPCRILDRSPISVRMVYDSREVRDSNWPWPFAAEMRYEVEAGSLTAKLGVQNLGDTPMPAGLGFHPFFMRRLWADDDVRVLVRTTGRYPVRSMIPSGPAAADEATRHLSSGQPLGSLALDDVFAGFDRHATITWPASGVEALIDCSDNLSHAVIFSPRTRSGGMEPWFCVEPVSMVTDGFNLMSRGQAGTGVTTVAPGDWIRATMTIRIQNIGAK